MAENCIKPMIIGFTASLAFAAIFAVGLAFFLFKRSSRFNFAYFPESIASIL
jgi:membrane-bound metal-dependent hydrolase YbcI (DUF457 family)